MKKYIFPAIISVIILFFFFQSIDLAQLVNLIKNADSWFLILSFFAYSVVSLLRAMRLKNIFALKDISLGKTWLLTNAHTFVSNILPSRLGELSLLFLMKKHSKISMGISSLALFLMRLLDLLIVSILFTVSLVYSHFQFKSSADAVILISLIFFLLILSFFMDQILSVLFVSLAFLKTLRIIQNINFLKNLELGKIQLDHKGFQLILSIFYTFGIWFMLMLTNLMVVKALGFNITLMTLIFASTAAVLTSLIPLSTFASLGTYEMGFIFVLTLNGFSTEVSTLIALSIHLLNMTYSAVLASPFMIIKKSVKAQLAES